MCNWSFWINNKSKDVVSLSKCLRERANFIFRYNEVNIIFRCNELDVILEITFQNLYLYSLKSKMLLRKSSSVVELLKDNDVILKYFHIKSINESRSSYHTQKSDLQSYHRLHSLTIKFGKSWVKRRFRGILNYHIP